MSDPAQDSPVPRTRLRADTATLLPASFKLDSEELPPAPIPERSVSNYTREHLQQSLTYASKFLARRKISPRSETFMISYKEEVKEALKIDSGQDHRELIACVRNKERLIQRKGFLQHHVSEMQTEMQDHILQLRELQYITRYGDYVEIVPMRLRYYSGQHKTENWELLGGRNYWSAIADQLSEEEKTKEAARRKGLPIDSVEVDTHIAVRQACKDLGVSYELAVWSIKEYGTRNVQVHRDLSELAKSGKFLALAKILFTDKEDLDSVFSEFRTATDKVHLAEIIQSEIDKWFDATVDLQNPEVWTPSDDLKQHYRKAREQAS